MLLTYVRVCQFDCVFNASIVAVLFYYVGPFYEGTNYFIPLTYLVGAGREGWKNFACTKRKRQEQTPPRSSVLSQVFCCQVKSVSFCSLQQLPLAVAAHILHVHVHIYEDAYGAAVVMRHFSFNNVSPAGRNCRKKLSYVYEN